MEPLVEESEARRASGEDPLEMQRRVARLETGVRLVAETLRRVHSDLSAALSELREEVVMTATSVDVRRIVTEVVQPLTQALEEFLGGPSPRLQVEPADDDRPTSDPVPPSDPPLEDERPQSSSPTGPAPMDEVPAPAPAPDRADPKWAPLPPEEASPVSS
jgi:hypothetical protein